jgi:DNA repair exonuclease SbcCD nuclease subunit
MKVLLVSDLHADWVTAGVSRFEEVERSLFQAVDHAVSKLGPDDLFVCLGDVSDPDCGPVGFRVSKMIVKAALRLWGSEITQLWVAGNHDPVMDGRGQTVLAPLKALEEELNFAGNDPDACRVMVAEGPCFFAYREALVLGLPYPGAVAYDPAKELETVNSARQKLLVFSHLVVPGASQGEEASEMARGKDVLFPVEAALKARPALIANGHHHRRQVVSLGPSGPDIFIPGSAARLRFGPEEEFPDPGFLVLTI